MFSYSFSPRFVHHLALFQPVSMWCGILAEKKGVSDLASRTQVSHPVSHKLQWKVLHAEDGVSSGGN